MQNSYRNIVTPVDIEPPKKIILNAILRSAENMDDPIANDMSKLGSPLYYCSGWSLVTPKSKP